jgi:hypothetical protein
MHDDNGGGGMDDGVREAFKITSFNGRHEIVDSASAEDLDAAKVAARTLWEDSKRHGSGAVAVHLEMPSGSKIVYHTRPD